MEALTAVIAARDAESTIRRAIESALEQHPTVRVVVVDDGSTDGTAAEVKGFRDDRVQLAVGRRAGAAAARNDGVLAADTEWVAFLDADDEWLPGHLEALSHAIAQAPDCVACFGAAQHIGVDGERINSLRMDPQEATVEGLLRRRLQPTTSATAVRRDALLAIGGFDEGFRRGAGVEDVDLWWRLAASGRCSASAEPRVRYYVHENRDRRRTRAELEDLAADRRRCIDRLQGRVPARLARLAAAQHHAMMARYWYVADFQREGVREAAASLRCALTRNGVTALAFGLLPRVLRHTVRRARRWLVVRGGAK
jgi:glycosyltransferase involved in cell wall biosynthesis